MTEPPDYVIDAARSVGAHSPCVKSKRGVVLFNPAAARLRSEHSRGTERVLVAGGFNAPPTGFHCKGTMVCRGSCRDVCLHAEQRAILAALTIGDQPIAELDLVHVKVVDGAVVAGGGPSCLQCSKLVVEVGIRGVWLFEAPSGIAYTTDDPAAPGVWRFYTANAFHEATLGNNTIASLGTCG